MPPAVTMTGEERAEWEAWQNQHLSLPCALWECCSVTVSSCYTLKKRSKAPARTGRHMTAWVFPKSPSCSFCPAVSDRSSPSGTTTELWIQNTRGAGWGRPMSCLPQTKLPGLVSSVFFFFLLILAVKPRASHTSGKHFTTELHLQLFNVFNFKTGSKLPRLALSL